MIFGCWLSLALNKIGAVVIYVTLSILEYRNSRRVWSLQPNLLYSLFFLTAENSNNCWPRCLRGPSDMGITCAAERVECCVSDALCEVSNQDF